MCEETVVILKPDSVKRQLVGRILQRFEDADLKIVRLEMKPLTLAVVEAHYQHLKERPFFSELCSYMTESPVVLVILKGSDAVTRVRKLVGSTNPLEAESGSIRGCFAINQTRNAVHASDSVENAQLEILRFFGS